MEYQKQAHAVYYTRYHIVVSTKYRRKIFKEGIWSIGYFVSTVGINESVIRKYIEAQEKEDSGQAKLVME